MTTPASPPIARAAQSPAAAFPMVTRFFRFSLTDVLFLGILLWTVVLAATGWGRLLQDGDTGLHIRIGDFILQNGHVPTTDPFSFTRNGHHWLASEWLTGVFFSFLNTHVGLKGVVFVSGVAIAATLTVILRTCLAMGANSLIALVLVLMTANASSFHYHARPHVFTWLALAISVHLLGSKNVWWLVPITIVWTNLHGGFAVLFAVLGIYLVGTSLEDGIRSSRLKRYAVVTAACAVASLINPFGYKLHLETLKYLGNKSILNTIQEFQAPNFRSEPQMYFMLLLFAGLGCAALLLTQRRYTHALLIFAFGYLALTSERHIPIFAILTVPIIAAELTRHWNAWAIAQPRTSIGRILHDVSVTVRGWLQPAGVWTAAGLAALVWLTPAAQWPSDFSNERFPVDIASRHSKELADTRLFTTDQWADYLMFKNPAQRVFVDDRALYDPEIIADALVIMDAAPGWRKAIEKYRINAVLCPAGTGISGQLEEDRGWKLIDHDETHLFFRAEAR